MAIIDDVVSNLEKGIHLGCNLEYWVGFEIPDVGIVTLEDKGHEYPGFDVIRIVTSDKERYSYKFKEFPNQFRQINDYIDKKCPGLIEKPPYTGICVNRLYPKVRDVEIVMTPGDFSRSYMLVDGRAERIFEKCFGSKQMLLSRAFHTNSCLNDLSEAEAAELVDMETVRGCDFRAIIARTFADIQSKMSSPIWNASELLSDITHIQSHIKQMRLYVDGHKQPKLEKKLTKFANEAEAVLIAEKAKLTEVFSGGLSDTRKIDFFYERQKMQERQRDLIELLNLLGLTGYKVDLTVKDGKGTISVRKDEP